MEVMAFLAITAALVAWRAYKRDRDRALAYAFVLVGLGIMAAIRGHAGGVVAFAVWTLVSYLLLNFPLAAALYLASAFCYIAELQGYGTFAIQIVSNLLGLAGLVAVSVQPPRWRYAGSSRPGPRRLLAMAYHAARGGARATIPAREEDK